MTINDVADFNLERKSRRSISRWFTTLILLSAFCPICFSLFKISRAHCLDTELDCLTHQAASVLCRGFIPHTFFQQPRRCILTITLTALNNPPFIYPGSTGGLIRSFCVLRNFLCFFASMVGKIVLILFLGQLGVNCPASSLHRYCISPPMD